MGKDPKILSSGRQDKAFYKAMWDALGKRDSAGRIVEPEKKRRSPIWHGLTINVVYNEDGSVRYYVELSNDFTEKKEAEDMIWRPGQFRFSDRFAESPDVA